MTTRLVATATYLLLIVAPAFAGPVLSAERVVFQTDFGDIEFAFMPEVAPVTVQHIFKLVVLGCYTSNHFFRVDKGFVAQTADVVGGRTIPMNAEQLEEANKNVPLEVTQDVKHLKGVLSMGRLDDPNSGASSFSMLLGDYPHLDMQYTIFGQITKGLETLTKMEGVEIKKDGIFLMPKSRVNIHATYWFIHLSPIHLPFKGAEDGTNKASESCTSELSVCKDKLQHVDTELHRVRHKCLPGT